MSSMTKKNDPRTFTSALSAKSRKRELSARVAYEKMILEFAQADIAGTPPKFDPDEAGRILEAAGKSPAALDFENPKSDVARMTRRLRLLAVLDGEQEHQENKRSVGSRLTELFTTHEATILDITNKYYAARQALAAEEHRLNILLDAAKQAKLELRELPLNADDERMAAEIAAELTTATDTLRARPHQMTSPTPPSASTIALQKRRAELEAKLRELQAKRCQRPDPDATAE